MEEAKVLEFLKLKFQLEKEELKVKLIPQYTDSQSIIKFGKKNN
jgi:hypothetical protein